MSIIKKVLKSIFGKTYHFVKFYYIGIKHRKEAKFLDILTKHPSCNRVFYFGPTTNQNLGDRGQVLCISTWIRKNYSDCEFYMLSAEAILDKYVHFLERFNSIYNENDRIIFQSGYNVNDMGANHPLMHKRILENFPNAKILMMPESIYYHSEENKARDAKFYAMGKRFLFLARDKKSLEILDSMCPNLPRRPFPDIVTTLIGQYKFSGKRPDTVCLCRRNDGEKYYSDEDLNAMVEKVKVAGSNVVVTDTTIAAKPKEIAANLKWYIENVIKEYAGFECMITDRFHGVVFSLVAGTPVVVIKTNNHKLTAALDWFKGVYDDYVYFAKDLDEAVDMVKKIKTKNFDHIMKPYFYEHYYEHLKDYWEQIIQ